MSNKSKKEDAGKNYVVFARKFRPQIFDDIKGQDAIVTTLKNAMQCNRVPQSFLFTGTRGVGKTSTARILAKSLNCETGPTIAPCGKCTSCMEITKGSSLDVIEIDGASNNSVDNIRDLRESIAMSPVHGKYKIYIIDEVHMLSQGAFNALLKTLEEPPAHAKFIFATTDAHKVPATILSRCQKFQFRRISLQEITSKLETISKEEKISADPEALLLIAKAGDGSMRDAESLFDQLSSFSKGKITAENVEKTLGLASFSLYLNLMKFWGKRDASGALQTIEKALNESLEIVPFTKGLYETVRNFLIIKVHPKPKGLIDLSSEAMNEVKKEAENFTEEALLAMSAILEKLIQTVQYSPAARFALEATVIRFASIADTASIPEILNRIEKMEKKTPSRLATSTSIPMGQPAPAAAAPSKPAAPPKANSPVSSAAPITSAPSKKSVDDTQQKQSFQPKANTGKTFFTLNEVENVWPQVILDVESQRMSLAPALTEAEPIETEEGFLVLGFPKEFNFHKETLEQNEIKIMIEKAFEQRLGAPIAIKVVLTEEEAEAAQPENTEEAGRKEIPPIVESALNIFKSGHITRHDK